MSLDFQQVRKKVIELANHASLRAVQLQEKREVAYALLEEWSDKVEELRAKVERVIRLYDPLIRTAVPVLEPLRKTTPPPSAPAKITLISADGSQILPDRNAPVDFCLINVGAVQLIAGAGLPPQVFKECTLLYGDDLITTGGRITEGRLNLMRDFAERKQLADLAQDAPAPVISFTDGPLELWMSNTADQQELSEFRKKQQEYMQVLEKLCSQTVVTAGFVDKPGAELVVRMLEVAVTPEDRLDGIRNFRPLRGLKDTDLFAALVKPGERSAVFKLHSRSAAIYPDEITPQFFLLNTGRENHADWARVEFPAWVSSGETFLNNLHAVLIQQCQLMGARPYPYLLHRAHETAVVSLKEKEEVVEMIMHELRRRGVSVGDASNKQSAKDLESRTRYKG